MNLLLAAPPRSVRVDGKSYPLDTRWRTALRVMAAFEDESLAAAEKQVVMLALLYKEGAPPDVARAAAAAVRFLNGCRPPQEEPDSQVQGGGRCFSWRKDGALILRAIQASHVLDLAQVEGLPWVPFFAPFTDLG